MSLPSSPTDGPTVHVIGAGIAGLAAAVRLVGGGHRVRLHEAAPLAGGRCRSWHDARLGLAIDNGNHLMMRANPALLAFTAAVGGAARLVEAAPARFAFLDLDAGDLDAGDLAAGDLGRGRRFTLAPNGGPVPWWIFRAGRRIPGTRPGDYLGLARLLRPPRGSTVADLVAPDHPLWRAFVEPLTLAVLNTVPARADAGLLARVLWRTFARGEAACRPRSAERGLGAELIDPAVAWLRARGVTVEHGRRLKALEIAGGAIGALGFAGETVALGPGDRVVLALPVQAARTLVPGLATPGDGETILNAHFRLPSDAEAGAEHGAGASAAATVGFVGVLGGTAHWVFRRGAVASVTVSAAGALDAADPEALARTLWRETVAALGRPAAEAATLPPYRLIRERRATFAQAPADIARRPGPATRWSNLFLAGDWTDTGLPATLESAAASGHAAAALVGRLRPACG